MNVHYYIKAAALATMIALTVVAVRREHKHPVVLVTKVTELIVMSQAEAAPVVIVRPVERKVAPKHVVKVGAVSDAVQAVLPKREPTSHTKPTDGSGAAWTFPYSCRTVKWAASTFSEATLESMRKKAGERLPTPAERQQISECIAGRFQ